MIKSSSAIRATRPTIGLLSYGADDPTCRALWSGVDDVAREYNVNLISFRAEPLRIPQEFLAQANVLYDIASEARLDGLVVWGGVLAHYVSHEDVLALLDTYAGIPLVNISSRLPDVPNVLIDNYQGTYKAVTHLVEAHHKQRIAFVRGPEGHVEAEARYRGYRDALRDHGMEIVPDRVAPGDFARETGLDAVRLLVEERKVSFDAVVTANDQLAIDVMAGLQARGVKVPGAVAVIGFDNRPESRFVTPALTTIDQPWREMGRRAAEQLVMHLVEGRELLPDVHEVPPRLVTRESCGCVARSIRMVVSQSLPQLSRSASDRFQISEEVTERVLEAMKDAASGVRLWAVDEDLEALVTALASDLEDASNREFLERLESLLHFGAGEGAEISLWHNLISVMRRELLALLSSVEILTRAEDLWQQARVMIGKWSARVQAIHRIEQERRQIVLAEIGQLLSTSIDLKELTERIVRAVERLDIPRCYLSLYEDPSDPKSWSRLLLAYAQERDASYDGTRFPSRQLLPTALMPSQRFSLHVEPLYFRTDQLGFVMFEADPRRGDIYGILQSDISRALYGSLLLERAERRAAQIQTAAEVAQASGQFLDTDVLIRRVVDLVRERFGLYYVGLFLVDETGTWAVLRAGTGQAGQEMVAEGHRLRVGGDSMIGQCVANQTARIALDVGEEAVRFDNPWLPATRSEMALPLVGRGEIVGALTVQSAEAAAFGDVDVASFQVMADQLANAIANARLYEQAQLEIAERRRTEKALARQEYRLRVLLDNTPDHIFFKDHEGRFIEVSQALMDWFGVEQRDEIIGKSDFDFFAEEHARPAYEDEQRVMQTGEPILEKEEKEVWADGRVTWVSTSKMPMRDRDGDIVGIFGVSRDITPLKEAMQALERRGNQLQIAAEVARTVTGIRDVDVLLQRVVELVRERFDLYYVGLFLIVERGEWTGQPERWAVLRSGSGAVGQQLLEEGYQLLVDEASAVGRCILQEAPQVIRDVRVSEEYQVPPLLSETCSEVALPLLSRGKPIGALAIHAKDVDALTEERVTAFQTMTGQIAIAIENARLMEQTQAALAEMATMQRLYIQQAWDEYVGARAELSYKVERAGELVVDEVLEVAMREAVDRQDVVVLPRTDHDGETTGEILVVPALVRGQPIGAVALENSARDWTTDEIAMARLLTERMALTAETLRLFEETQQAATRERLLSEVAARVRERLDVETVLRTAADEIYDALELESVTVRLASSESSPPLVRE